MATEITPKYENVQSIKSIYIKHFNNKYIDARKCTKFLDFDNLISLVRWQSKVCCLWKKSLSPPLDIAIKVAPTSVGDSIFSIRWQDELYHL